MYKCGHCSKYFQNKRRQEHIKSDLLFQYVWQRQTYSDLAQKYGKSDKWVKKRLDEIEVKPIVTLRPQPIVAVVDTTFFSGQHGVTVFREPNKKKNLWWQEVVGEKAEVYHKGREALENNGFTPQAVVSDGRQGVRRVFEGIPTQMCHFHQKQITNRYLTTRPKLQASKELRAVVSTLSQTNEIDFTTALDAWHEKWKEFLKEKTTSPETGRWYHTHKRVRSAYRSLRTNLPDLFTYQKYLELKIPNTTNSLDGFFNRLKSLLNVHRGLNSKRRRKVMVVILKGKGQK